jgi:hypothetical protein
MFLRLAKMKNPDLFVEKKEQGDGHFKILKYAECKTL